jgi:hypothetical protein
MTTDTYRHHVPAGAEEGDTVLETLVRLADRHDLKVGITLYMGGTMLSGVLVSGRDWFDGTAMRLSQARGSGEAAKVLADFFRQQRDQEFPASGEADPDDTDGEAPVGYIHLAGARPFDAGGSYLREGMWWRGRIDRVDGFHFGVVDDSGPRHPRTS